jgi:hypothetical protein
VIAYNVDRGHEAPRLYLDSQKVFAYAKEQNYTEKSKYGQELIAKFLYNRLNIVENLDENDTENVENNDSNSKDRYLFHVSLGPLLSDTLLGRSVDNLYFGYDQENENADINKKNNPAMDVLGNRPAIEVFEIQRNHETSNAKDFNAKLKLLQEDTVDSKANIEAAESLTEIALDSSRGFAPKRHWGKALTVVTGVVRVSLIVKRYLYMYLCIHVYVYVCKCMYVRIYTYVCMYIHIYVYIYIYIYTYLHMYIYICTGNYLVLLKQLGY